MKSRLQRYAARVFTVDLRALASMRIAIGFLILADLVGRWPQLDLHYTDAGIFPVEVSNAGKSALALSLHALSGGRGLQVFLFAIAALFALSLILGFRTRVSTLVSWVLLVSLHNRNVYVLQAGDTLIRVTLFWAMFLPWGARYSMDAFMAKQGGAAPGPNRHYSVATIAYTLQIVFVYAFTLLLKSGPQWLPDGTAVYYVLHVDYLVNPLFKPLTQYPGALRALTYSVLAFELFGTLALISPFITPLCRLLALVGFVVLHVGFGSSLAIGLFPWISVGSMLGLIPSEVFERRTSSPEQAPSKPGAIFGLSGQRRLVVDGFVTACLVYVFIWNVSALPAVPSLARPLRMPAQLLRLDQKWDMFAPSPILIDGWFVVRGELEGGEEIDPIHGGPVSLAKPEDPRRDYVSYRQRKLMMWLRHPLKAHLRKAYADYLCRSYGNRASAGDRLVSVSVSFMEEDVVIGSGDRLRGEKPVISRSCLDRSDPMP